jgi:VIT1/CCC1 family predicted Fe2+/Mn2+ transporter
MCIMSTRQERHLSRARSARAAGDPLAAHRRDELGQTDQSRARPNQAAAASAAAFATGAMVPVLAAVPAPGGARAAVIAAAALVSLIALGGLFVAREANELELSNACDLMACAILGAAEQLRS